MAITAQMNQILFISVLARQENSGSRAEAGASKKSPNSLLRWLKREAS
jgi:hypothetical protein